MEEIDYLYLNKGTILKQNYIVDNIIGERSNFSIVYKGTDIEKDKRIVIKEFFPKNMVLRDMDKKSVICRNNNFKKRFEIESSRFINEGNIMKKVEGNNSAECYDVCKENGTAYIVMKYHSGSNLEECINEKKYETFDLFLEKVMYPVMDAVDRVHNKGYIHRDIKPTNIIIEKSEKPILIDFGSAVHIDMDKEKKIMVTPGFSPIEFYSEKSIQTKSSDVYSIAAMLYYYFCGEIPPESTTRIIEDNIKKLEVHNKSVPIFIAKLIMKNLSMKSNKRDSSIKVFKSKLKIAVKMEKVKRNIYKRKMLK